MITERTLYISIYRTERRGGNQCKINYRKKKERDRCVPVRGGGGWVERQNAVESRGMVGLMVVVVRRRRWRSCRGMVVPRCRRPWRHSPIGAYSHSCYISQSMYISKIYYFSLLEALLSDWSNP